MNYVDKDLDCVNNVDKDLGCAERGVNWARRVVLI